jgi:phenylacetate-CoA ligase
MPIHDEKQETMPRAELRQLQIERLQSTLNRVCRNVAFYRRLFDERRIETESIKDHAALATLPFTTKADLKQSYPYDLFAVPLRDVVRIQATSGTTGKPVGIGYTQNDLRHWAALVMRVLEAADVSAHDTIQIAYQYSLFTGGFGFHQGAERLGASVIPASSVVTLERQIEIMRDFKTTVLCSTPSFAARLGLALEEQGRHPETLRLRVALLGGEPWSEQLRTQIEERLHCRTFDSYGLSEVLGPGIAGECAERRGLHVQEDHFIVEIVDPETGTPLPPGENGELVFTTIAKEAYPLIRYRTGDMASLDEGPCPCGRTFARMSRVTGRTDDLVFAQGIKFFPSQIEDILLRVEGVAPHFRIEITSGAADDKVAIQAELTPKLLRADPAPLALRAQKELEATLGLRATVSFLMPGALPVPEGKKAVPVIDRRGR